MSSDLRLEVAKSVEQLRLIADDLERPASPIREYEQRVARRLAKLASVLADVLDRTDPQRRGGGRLS